MGFEEIPHTADWALRVWADDLPGLLAESARGMNWLAGAKLAKAPRQQQTLEIEAADAESLLVAFLSELVYYAEQEKIGFNKFEFKVDGVKLKVMMQGAPLHSLTKAIKAVTWHNINIEKTRRGLEVEIVFDV